MLTYLKRLFKRTAPQQEPFTFKACLTPVNRIFTRYDAWEAEKDYWRERDKHIPVRQLDLDYHDNVGD